MLSRRWTSARAAALQEAFNQLADTPPQEPLLHIEHREIRALRLAGSVVWFDFATLCGGPARRTTTWSWPTASTP